MLVNKNATPRTTIKICKTVEGETIEVKMRRLMQQGADINDVTELIFTERKDGVLPETNIRHDRWETAIEAVDEMSKAHLTKRNERHNPPKTEEGGPKTDTNNGGGTE